MEKILCINYGSTSTKVAVYRDENELCARSVSHTQEELSQFEYPSQQYDFRKRVVVDFLSDNGIDPASLTCVMSRGGVLPPLKAGGYRINQMMLDFVQDPDTFEHANNLACRLADEIAKKTGVPAYIYDCGSTDEMPLEMHLTGIPEIRRISLGHELNPRYVSRKCAEELLHKRYEDCTFIVVHLGGGASVSLRRNGRVIQKYSDDCMAPERAGRLPAKFLINLCYSGKYTQKKMQQLCAGNGGLKAYFGSPDARLVERRIDEGDAFALAVYTAMANSISGTVGELATLAQGKVDRIIITGGMANSEMYTGMIRKNCEWIAPVVMMPGEFEMLALALGGLRILSGEEPVNEFVWHKGKEFDMTK